ncbi:MAG: lysophospholipid acyltransferase family protein, partial [Dehalococcoidia bacterium]
LSKFILTKMNSLETERVEKFEALSERGGRGLLTFSNHTALFDDPMLPSIFHRGGWDEIRWVATDALNFYSTWPTAFIFSSGKGVPVVRGAGFDQPGFDFLRDRLNEGRWVHIFPEGGRTRREDSLLSKDFKSGIGRLIAETNPIGLPFYHLGMQEVLPIGAKFPRWGKNVRLVFGDAIDFSEELVGQIAGSDEAMQHGPELWDALTGYTYEVLSDLERVVRSNGSVDG